MVPARTFQMFRPIFEKCPEAFRADAASGVDVAIQFSITGEGGGEWYTEIRGGICRVEAGHLFRSSCTITMDGWIFST